MHSSASSLPPPAASRYLRDPLWCVSVLVSRSSSQHGRQPTCSLREVGVRQHRIESGVVVGWYTRTLKDPPKPYIVTRKLYRTTQSWTSYCLAPTHSLLSLSPLTPAPCLLLLPLLAGLHCYSTNVQPQRPGTRLLQPTYRLYPPHHHYHGSQKHTPITAFTTALASLH